MPLLSSISYQICKSSSVFPFLFSSDIPQMNAMLDLLREPGKKGLSTTKLAVLLLAVLFAAAIVWFAIPLLFVLLSSAAPRIWTHLRSSIAPPYLFVAVNFIIFTIWKLSENRALHTDRFPEEERSSNPELIHPRPRDLGSSHTVDLHAKTSAEDCHEIPSIPDENAALPYRAGEELSPAPASELSRVTTECADTQIAASSCSSAVSAPEPALIPKNRETEETTINDLGEEASLDATWNSIMQKSGRWDKYPPPPPAAVGTTAGRVSAATPRRGNALSEGNDEINQRFDEFIKKSYDQIRLRKPGESIQPWRIH